MAGTALYDVSCHCGAVRQTVSSLSPSAADDVAHVALCHCWSCRHTTGVLCTSYIPIVPPASLEPTTAYHSSDTTTRYFCSTCGCHCFLKRVEDGEKEDWRVASGVISGEFGNHTEQDTTELFLKHNHVDSTVDGGLSIWMPGTEPWTGKLKPPANLGSSNTDYLSGRCHCNSVTLRITRPDASSQLPKSYYPDLMIPYKDKSPQAANPEDEKWWLRDGHRYMAGTCACKSCRLISGFEIQTWAFIPRNNIFIQEKPLQFPMDGVLRSYVSSSAVTREFCPRCGATVFWHDTLRPDLIDVSVGLFEAEGARAQDWLYWWRERVSFAEDARLGRSGCFAQMAETLVHRLEAGMRQAMDAEAKTLQ